MNLAKALSWRHAGNTGALPIVRGFFRGALLKLVVFAVGCGDPVVPLCDGTDGLTLRIFTQATGQEVIGGAVRVENGFPSFAVDGQCRYFVSGGWIGSGPQGRDMGWRTGKVSDDMLDMLERLAGKEDLDSINDCSGVLLDAGAFVVANTRSALFCFGNQGRRVRRMSSAMDDEAYELWEQGLPLDQDLHITVRAGATLPPGERTYPWPSALSLPDYFEADGTIYASEPLGNSKRVPAAESASLRALREQYLQDTRSPNFYRGEGIPVTDGQLSGVVFMRDALPYENDKGLWPLPGD